MKNQQLGAETLQAAATFLPLAELMYPLNVGFFAYSQKHGTCCLSFEQQTPLGFPVPVIAARHGLSSVGLHADIAVGAWCTTRAWCTTHLLRIGMKIEKMQMQMVEKWDFHYNQHQLSKTLFHIL